jgi:hypothetical protein
MIQILERDVRWYDAPSTLEGKMKIRGCLIIVLVGFYFYGCADPGVQYDDQVLAIYLSKSMVRERTKKVWANAEAWRNSGVIVERGKVYRINANGRWRCGPRCDWTGPDGKGAYSLFCWGLSGQIVKDWSHSALVARIGEDGIPFGVGGHLELKPKKEGILYYRIGDRINRCGDNEGVMTVSTLLIKTEY